MGKTYAGKAKRKLASPNQSEPGAFALNSDSVDDDHVPKRPRTINIETEKPGPHPHSKRLGTPPHNSNSSTSYSQNDSLSPRKSVARDLTQIFEETLLAPRSQPKAKTWHSGLGSSPPKPHPKKMLARSKTESSLPRQAQSHTTSSSLTSPTSLSTFPSLASTSLVAAQQGPRSSPPPSSPNYHEPSRSMRSTNQRTYAGPSRSFLVAIPANADGSLSNSHRAPNTLDEDTEQSRESYADLRERLGVDALDENELKGLSLPSSSRATRRSRNGPPERTSSVSPPKVSRKGKQKAVAEEEAEPLPDGMMNPLKSITELRSKGEAQRFMDEVGYLLEGLGQESGIGLKRASALEILTNLCDPEFARRSRSTDFIRTSWDLLLQAGGGRPEGDLILRLLTASFAAVASRDERQLSDLASDPDFTSILLSLALFFDGVDRIDPLVLESGGVAISDGEWKKAGIGRREKAMVSSIAKLIRDKSGLYQDSLLSTSLLASTALVLIPRLSPSPSHFADFMSAFERATRPILQIVPSPPTTVPGDDSSDLTDLSDQEVALPSKANGNRKASQVELPNVTHLLNLLKVLEAFLLDSSIPLQALEETRHAWLVDVLVAAGVYGETIAGDQTTTGRDCVDISTRLLVAVTHRRQGFCHVFASNRVGLHSVVRRIAYAWNDRQRCQHDTPSEQDPREASLAQLMKERRRMLLDRLCVSLALITNVAHLVGGMLPLLNDLEVDPSCQCSKVECLSGTCRCDERGLGKGSHTSGTEILIGLYTDQERILSVKVEPPQVSEADEELADAVFLSGHLAVVFGLLMMGSPKGETGVGPYVRKTELASKVRDFLGLLRVAVRVEGNRDRGLDDDAETVDKVLRFLEEQDQ